MKFISLQGIEVDDTTELTKHVFRESVWKYLEENEIAAFPLPVHGRIPNFKDASACGPKVADLPEFGSAHTIKINPDKPQEEVRFEVVQAGKRLLVPSPRLKKGLFNALEKSSEDDSKVLRTKAQSYGMTRLSKPIDLTDKVKIDLIVIGSTAVSTTGYRIGKRGGFADLEYAMMKTMEAVSDDVTIVTTVHDSQVFDELPSKLFGEHDVPVDIIITPTRVINVESRLPRPQKIYWNLLTKSKLRHIPVLKLLRKIDQENGVDVTLSTAVEERPSSKLGARKKEGARGGRRQPQNVANGEDYLGPDGEMDEIVDDLENLQITIRINKKNKIVGRNIEASDGTDHMASSSTRSRIKKKTRKIQPTFSLFIGNIPWKCRVSDIKEAMTQRSIKCLYMIKRPAQRFAFAYFSYDVSEKDRILNELQGITVADRELVVMPRSRKSYEEDDAEPLEGEQPESIPEECPVQAESEVDLPEMTEQTA